MKTAFSRAFFPAAIILLVALLLVGISFQMTVRNYLTKQVQQGLSQDSQTLADLAAAYAATSSVFDRDFLTNLTVATQVSGSDAIICDARGRLLICSDSPLGCQHQGLVLQNRDYLQQIINDGTVTSAGAIPELYSEPRYVAATAIRSRFDNTILGFVLVSTPQTQVVSVLKEISDTYLLISLLVVAVAAIVMTVYARKFSAPLKELAKTAHAFGHGQLSARVHLAHGQPQETQELALAFNNMAASLEKSEYQRTEFVANVSHELKTPMTTIGGYVDGILDGTIPQEKHRHYLSLVSDETKRLSRLVRSMLDISRLQNQEGIPQERKSRFDVCECAGRTLLSFEQKILQKQLHVQASLPDYPVFTMADPDAITQVIYNLLDNAIKFCPEEKEISLSLRTGRDKIYISISNQGETIPSQELPLLFDRFHKLDKSRSQNRDGWGLGLYIVKTIICGHGENISVSSANEKTEFTFTLPLIN